MAVKSTRWRRWVVVDGGPQRTVASNLVLKLLARGGEHDGSRTHLVLKLLARAGGRDEVVKSTRRRR